ncbi:hypothetical protein [Luteibacter sp. ME-Dv--P-043b]|uniref:hypothetical protein n=1 Tax=unclassified Luteibacter TaxID=2620188 RepID=UPI0025522667|nr:hypothetical protein [Luteibacter sp. ME-Dv--P-043b]
MKMSRAPKMSIAPKMSSALKTNRPKTRGNAAASPSRKRETIRTSGKRVRRQRTMRARGRA